MNRRQPLLSEETKPRQFRRLVKDARLSAHKLFNSPEFGQFGFSRHIEDMLVVLLTNENVEPLPYLRVMQQEYLQSMVKVCERMLEQALEEEPRVTTLLTKLPEP